MKVKEGDSGVVRKLQVFGPGERERSLIFREFVESFVVGQSDEDDPIFCSGECDED